MSDVEVAEPTPGQVSVSPVEVGVPTVPEGQAIPPDRTEPEPVPEPPVEQQGTAPTTYEEWQAQLEGNADWKAVHEEREAERTKQLRKEEYNKFRSVMQRPLEESAQAAQGVLNELREVNASIRQAVADGTLDVQAASQVLGSTSVYRQGYEQGGGWLLEKVGGTIQD